LGLIPDDKIAEIRDRTDIVQVIGEYVTLRRAGASHVGLCPFHNEKTPSFNVIPAKQFFHCFGCGKSGDVYTFLSEVEGKSFVDVARELARRAGVDLPAPEQSREARERAQKAESERARLVRLHELAAAFYRAQLDAPVGERARAYLDQRGIGEKTRETFRVGYAPAGWDALTRHFEAKKVPHELAERSGLVRRRDNARLADGAPPSKATHYDMFVDRVVYALTSPVGEVIGFGGRVLESLPDQPKYKNSPETLIYKKGENLFGLHAAKHAIRRGGRALIVEGNFDVMTLHDRGVDYAVAPQGTALTPAQVGLLKRFAGEVLIALDADAAGRAATLKVVRLFAQAELKAKIVSLKARDGKKLDPDELVRTDQARFDELVAQAQEAVEFYFTQVAAAAEPSVPGRVRAIEECVPVLRELRNPMLRDAYCGFLAELMRVDRRLVDQAMRGAQRTDERDESHPVEPIAQRAIERRAAKLLAFLAQHVTLIARMTPDVVAAIPDDAARELIARAVERGVFSAPDMLALAPPTVRDAVARAFADNQYACDEADKRDLLFTEITRELLAGDQREALEAERRHALERGDMDAWRVLSTRLREYDRLRKVLQGESSR
jgi:DNA primase